MTERQRDRGTGRRRDRETTLSRRVSPSLRLSIFPALPRAVSRSPHRRGYLSLELALTLPILGLVLAALFEFSLLFEARGSVVTACRVGARKATLPGVTETDVAAVVRRGLPPRLRNAAEVDVGGGDRTGDPVTVAVRVPMNRAAPDLLWPIGYSLDGRFLDAETRMIRE